MNYQIITDEVEFDKFISFLPDLEEDEVFYLSLFGRHKYYTAYPNMRDDKQVSRFIARKNELKEKVRRLESPIGSYARDGEPVPQEALALYIGMNPKNLRKANKELLCSLARRISDNDTNFSPISLATTEIHKASGRKFFVDFDFDNVKFEDYKEKISDIFVGVDCYKVLQTRGGFHLLVELSKVGMAKSKWHQLLTELPACDVRGSNTLTPFGGCYQGGFTPRFI